MHSMKKEAWELLSLKGNKEVNLNNSLGARRARTAALLSVEWQPYTEGRQHLLSHTALNLHFLMPTIPLRAQHVLRFMKPKLHLSNFPSSKESFL